MRHLLVLIKMALAVTLAACQEPRPADENLLYYNVNAELRRHIRALHDEGATLIKYTTANGRRNHAVFPKPNWHKEFDVLFSADIRVPYRAGHYTTDTTHMEDGSLLLVYKTNHVDAPVKELTVSLQGGGGMRSFKALKRTGTSFNDVTTVLHYDAFDSYRIDVRESPRVGQQQAFTVIGEIVVEPKFFK